MNGILILDKRYIHNIQMNQSSKYQLKMMKHFGLIKDINPVHFNVKNWRNFFDSIASQHTYCMIENEYMGLDITYIGKINKVKKHHIVMHEFSGAGN